MYLHNLLFLCTYAQNFLLQADLYVNTCGSDLVLKNGAMARSFLKAGGQALQDECNGYISQNGQISVGGVVLTKPGAIPCQGIIHTVGKEYNGKESEDVSFQLTQNKVLRYRSIISSFLHVW